MDLGENNRALYATSLTILKSFHRILGHFVSLCQQYSALDPLAKYVSCIVEDLHFEIRPANAAYKMVQWHNVGNSI